MLLIRRNGRRTAPTRACFAIHTGPDRPWIERVDLGDVRDVATLDLEGLGRGGSVGLTATDGPLFAVCTHGRRDPCCAERGRPLASSLSQGFPDETWESTHIGGDRFAGNMIAFPHGFYFGRVGPAQGAEIAAAYVAGTLDLEHLRGRACRATDVQAAEQYLRAQDALTGIDDVTVLDVSRAGPQTSTTFRTPLGLRRVEIHRDLGPEERLTCHSVATMRPPRFALLGIESA